MSAKSKQLLRQELLATRRTLPDFAKRTKIQRIVGSLSRVYPWDQVSSLHIYESIDDLNEVNTKDFITLLKKNYPKIKIYTSRRIKDKWVNVSLDNKPAGNTKFDVIIVPMLGFDNSLNRLGYGGGYYDKFLSKQKRLEKLAYVLRLVM